MEIGIVGAGHAGVNAALTAAKAGNDVTLFSNEKMLPYFRPRIPAAAFGQVEIESMAMHPLDWYKEEKIDLKLDAEITAINSDNKTVTASDKEYSFDKIIVTTGAGPILPPFAKDCDSTKVIPLWNAENALKINQKVAPGNRLVIIGGGVIGIEAALRANDVGLNVSIIERQDFLMQRILINKVSVLLQSMLQNKGIKILTGQCVQEIDDASSVIKIKTDKTEKIESDLVLLSIGAKMNTGMIKDDKIRVDRGVVVNDNLQSTDANVFAAGDVAQVPSAVNICSAIKALKQGKIAGHNVGSASSDFIQFVVEPIGVQLKYNEFVLSVIGCTKTDDSEVKVLEDTGDKYRALIQQNGKICGIQMLGSLEDYKKHEREFLSKS